MVGQDWNHKQTCLRDLLKVNGYNFMKVVIYSTLFVLCKFNCILWTQLNSNQIKIIGEKVRPEGTRGALEELKNFLKTKSSQEFDLDLFGDLNDQTIDDAETAEIDYLDEDVAIFDLIRFT